MHLDAAKLDDGTTLETGICIVGSGPAGLTLARELAGSGLDLLILESGSRRPDPGVQELNAGEVVGDPYRGLRDTRHRQVGGAPNIWNTPVARGSGAKYVPLDPWDFLERPGIPLSGWPFGFDEVEPFYRRAQAVCGLGPFRYGGRAWRPEEKSALGSRAPGAGGSGASGGHLDLVPELAERVYQFGPQSLFTRSYVEELDHHPDVRLLHGATLRCLRLEGGGRRAVEGDVAVLGSGSLRVRARAFVLAAGAVENARILLLSGDGEDRCPGNAHGWVGRCFMEHPRDHGLSLTPYSPRLFSEVLFYDRREGPGGTVVGGRLGLTRKAVEGEALPNASVTLLPKIRERSSLWNWAVRFWLCPHSSGLRGFRGGYGWSRMKDPARWLEGFRLVVNTEQRPHPENRIVLSGKKDALGVPRAELHWRWRPREQADLERLRSSLATWMERSGFGRVAIRKELPPDPNACHHAGTTRMHADPQWGVTDPHGRVHGTDNLFVAGGSLFPTSGYANPTLTIVALALRLADHLAQGV